jgi:hypothetical protein
MGKLHELIAVEPSVENIYKKIFQESLTTFTKKQDNFMGFVRNLQLKDDNRKMEEEAAKEQKEMVTTIRDKIDYFFNFAEQYLDLLFQKENANQQAKANLEIEGKIIAENVPVTYLLGLETKLKALRSLFETIPTLSPGIKWIKDPNRKNTYITENEEIREKTEKTLVSKVLAPASDKHPAQVEKWFEDSVIGVFRKTTWTGLITPKQKSDLLTKIDNLIVAVKRARQKANEVEVTNDIIARKLLSYIVSDL